MSESWPDHSSELARKAMDLVHRQACALAAREISEKEFWFVLDTLADVTQGLIPSDVWQIIYECRQDIGRHDSVGKNL